MVNKINLKYWQIGFGQSLVRILRGVIFHTGMFDQYKIVSFPDGPIYRIKVFRLDPSGESVFEGSKTMGFEFFRIKIELPDSFTLSLFDDFGKRRGASRLCKSPENLAKEAKAVLEEILCLQWLKFIKSCR